MLAPTAVDSLSERTGESRSMVEMEAASTSVERVQDVNEVGMAMDVDAPMGPAGIAEEPTKDIGLPTRMASRESEAVALQTPTRFRSKRFGSSPAVSTDAIMAKKAFRSRTPKSMAAASSPVNERAINLGLEFLARHQSADGSWSLTGFDRGRFYYKNQLECDTAATGLALLAFQGAGYNHREFKYASLMEQAIQWLIENQSEDGSLFVESGTRADGSCRLYAHGIAALALTEAYGMTQDPELRGPAQRALDFIANTQDPKRGGWRYYTELKLRQTDTSVTGWMMMSLQSGRLAGLDVKDETLQGIDEWLEVAAGPDKPSEFRYNPFSKDTDKIDRSQGRVVSPPMTAVGLLMQIYNGWEKDDPRLVAGAQALLDQRLPSDTTKLLRDTYYWYYATQVLLHVGGEHWEEWESNLHPLLVKSQVQAGDLAGSWDPYSPVPDRWGVHAGRLYVTAMNLLSLEVKNRKLPIYDEALLDD